MKECDDPFRLMAAEGPLWNHGQMCSSITTLAVCSLFWLFTVSPRDDGLHMEQQRPDRTHLMMTVWRAPADCLETTLCLVEAEAHTWMTCCSSWLSYWRNVSGAV